jgi:hypothetical protein
MIESQEHSNAFAYLPEYGQEFFFSKQSRLALGPNQTIKWVPGALSSGVKQQGREADHSPPISAKVKKTDLHIHSPIQLHTVVLS